MSKSCLSLSAQTLILLDKQHYLTELIVVDAQRRVIHNGVKETVTELRSMNWLVKGRQLIGKVIHASIVCRKLEGKLCQGNPTPPPRGDWVQHSQLFQTTCVDFGGPLYVRTPDTEGTSKCGSVCVHAAQTGPYTLIWLTT